MEGDSRAVTAALHGCRSEGGVAGGPPRARGRARRGRPQLNWTRVRLPASSQDRGASGVNRGRLELPRQPPLGGRRAGCLELTGPVGRRGRLDVLERAELALGGLRSAEPRLGEPWPSLGRAGEDRRGAAGGGRGSPPPPRRPRG